MITKDAIIARQKELQAGALQLRDQIWHLKEALKEAESNLFATNGAIEDCEYWLNQLGVAELQSAIDKALDEKAQKNATIKETSRETLNDFMRRGNGVVSGEVSGELHYADSNGLGY